MKHTEKSIDPRIIQRVLSLRLLDFVIECRFFWNSKIGGEISVSRIKNGVVLVSVHATIQRFTFAQSEYPLFADDKGSRQQKRISNHDYYVRHYYFDFSN